MHGTPVLCCKRTRAVLAASTAQQEHTYGAELLSTEDFLSTLYAFSRALLQACSGLVPRTEFPAMTQAHLLI